MPDITFEDERLMAMLVEKGDYVRVDKIAATLNIAMQTAYNVARKFAAKFPDNVDYDKGTLRLTKGFAPEQKSERELRQFFQKLAETESQKRHEVEEKLKNWQHNHFNTIKKLLRQRKYGEAQKYMERIEKEGS